MNDSRTEQPTAEPGLGQQHLGLQLEERLADAAADVEALVRAVADREVDVRIPRHPGQDLRARLGADLEVAFAQGVGALHAADGHAARAKPQHDHGARAGEAGEQRH